MFKKKRDQIIDRAEQVLKDIGFTGIVEEDIRSVETNTQKQAFLIETLLYKYEHSTPTEKIDIQNKLVEALNVFTQIAYQEQKCSTPKELYDKAMAEAYKNPVDFKMDYKGDEVRIKAKLCGEYYDGESFKQVTSVEIFLNDECLYSELPREGVWACSTNKQGLKLVNAGMFDDVRDVFGYIDYIGGEYAC